MNTYEQSVFLDNEKCTGCTTCIHHCPTEAIRVKEHKAVINPAKCIDCGECINVCPRHALKAKLDTLGVLSDFKYTIALPAPTLFAQFDNLDDIDYVCQGLLDIGFDHVYEVSRAAELVSAYTRNYLKTEGIPKPAISASCPAVVRLIELRFPLLKENIIHMQPPAEVAAQIARRDALSRHPELSKDDIGVCFISPCPAKMGYVKNGFSDKKSAIDAVVPISDIYFQLIGKMDHDTVPETISKSGMIGIGWATSGGEAKAIFNDSYLAADGIDNVIRVLDQIENGNIPHLEFVELNACTGGCVGGALTIQNPFIAKARLQSLVRYLPVSQNFVQKEEQKYIPDIYLYDNLREYPPISRLSDNMAESMRMMADIQKLREKLPGYDCGSCGAPTCRAFAEDVVRGNAKKSDCVMILHDRFKEYLEKNGREGQD